MIIEFAALLVSLAALGVDESAATALHPKLLEVQTQRVQMLVGVCPAVVAVFGQGGSGGGSGVLIESEGYALTNFHVISGLGPGMKCGISDGRYYDAVLVGVDPVGDVALIKLLGRDDFPRAPLGDSDTLRLGETVFAVGNPFLLAEDFEPTVTMGIVSGLHRYQYPAGTILEYTDCIQTDASINPGNSGGPLFNELGELVGINGRGSFEKRGRVSVGVGYAISINQIKNFLDHLKGGLVIDHATLGATVVTDADGRVVVDQILQGSDVYRRGLRVDDEIISFAGRPIRSVNQFKNVLGIFPKEWRVPLSYRRDERRYDVVVRLGGVHRADELLKAPPRRPVPRPAPKKKPGEPPTPKRAQPSQSPIPEAVTRLYEKKEGFANYYFNRLRRDALLEGLAAKSGLAQRRGRWKLELAGEANDVFELTLTDEVVGWTSGEAAFAYTQGQDNVLDPPESGGLLVTLDHWRRIMIDGAKWFSACDFAGGVPDHDAAILLVLRAERAGVVSRWLFDRETGDLRGVECQVAEDGDPCELYFADFRPLGEVLFPHRWEVRYAGRTTHRLTVRAAELSP